MLTVIFSKTYIVQKVTCENEHSSNHKKLCICWQIIYAENTDKTVS